MGLAHLIGLSSAVLVSTLVASFAPLYAPLSQSKLEGVSLLASGILPGAALSVVIPEGVAALYRATAASGRRHGDAPDHRHADDDGDDGNTQWIGLALLTGFLLMYLLDSVHGHDNYVDPTPHHHPHRPPRHHHRHSSMIRPRFNPTPSHLAELEPLANGCGGAPARLLSSNDEYRSVSTFKDCCSDHDHHRDDDEEEEAAAAEEEERRRCGDVEAGGRGGRPCGVGGRRGIGRWDSAAMLRGSRPASPTRGDDGLSSPAGGRGGAAACPEGETDHHHHMMRADGSSFSTVVGLVAHSIADGISLGASSLPTPARAPSSTTAAAAAPSTPSSSLQLVVFIAIMLHKAPTAFALSSLLASSPANSRTFIRRALLIFSLAAPVGALVTYAILSLLGGSGGSSSTEWYTGLALVFSGGTFLFVATHALREQEKREERKQRQAAAAASSLDELDPPPAGLGDKARLVLVLVGMVLPATLSRVVGHGHG
ncbi:hypothetical protein C6P46_002642 [Rhodotorula mucilaginosa]|uniref:Uncharacterized protein n=1 Tax=Rhodotorula mucilaginosa TaxID=5537 RepID=A0A9P6W8H9_RHOMI|nr:hypothetical protein C6P46_002642 [Rhodotorula mucilaginosa]TKA55202.1 hypothetical protein B0A53_02172 [Rhodotorula sp. CCFEE 5036]